MNIGLKQHDYKRLAEILERENDDLRAHLQRVEAAAKPFIHPDLYKTFSNNHEGDKSIIFVRDDAVITIGDCKRLLAALKGDE